MLRPEPQSLLCLDVGKKRVGLAGCDSLGITVTQLPALHRKSFEEDAKVLKGYCNYRKVTGLVVGIPLDENGLITKQSKYCANYGRKMAKALDLPIAWVNEHSSTWEARKRFKLESDRTGQLDSASAAVLLEQWLCEGSKPTQPSSNKLPKP